VLSPSYGRSRRKAEARKQTIFDQYRLLSGRTVLRGDLHYVTLCGPLSEQGQLLPRCELLHVLDYGLICTPSQFHGIERQRPIHDANVAAATVRFPDNTPHFYLGEVTRVLDENLKTKRILPGIVYLDLLQAPQSGSGTLSKVISNLNHYSWPILLVCNLIVSRTYPSRHTFYHHLPAVDSVLKQYCDGRWTQFKETEYGGTNERRSQTKMRTLTLWKDR
jgi:hypothetical protein